MHEQQLERLDERLKLVEDVLHLAVRLLRAILEKGDIIVTDISDLQDQMTAIEAAVAKNAADTKADANEIKALLDQIAAGAGSGVSPADIQALTARAKAVVDSITANNAALEAAIPVAPSPPAAPAA